MPLAPSRQKKHFLERLLGCPLQRVDVLVRHNHHVPGGVRKNIENDKIARAAKDDEIRLVILLGRHAAEDATGFLLGLLDVLIAPWGPEAVHKRLKSFRYEL